MKVRARPPAMACWPGRLRRGAAMILLGAAAVANAALVRDVRIENTGPGAMDTAFVRSYLQTVAGEEFSPAVVARDVKALLATDRFTDVSADVEEQTNGVAVIYRVVPRYTLSDPPSVQVDGKPRFRVAKIIDFLGLQPGMLVDDQAVGVAVQDVLRKYRDAGYGGAKVTWDIEPSKTTNGTARLSVQVVEGRKAKVRKIVFEGVDKQERRDLAKVAEPRGWYNPMRWFSRRKWEDAFEQDLLRQDARTLFRNRGYLDAQVATPEVRWDADGKPRLHVRVERGEVYTLGALQVDGRTLFPREKVDPLVVLKPGDPASVAKLQDAATRMEEYYGERGYIDTTVRVLDQVDATNRVANITFAIQEGELVHIRNIHLRGNTRTRDRVIRRELLVAPGDIYNETLVNRSERTISNLGFFKDVAMIPGPTGETHERDLIVDVEEQRTGQFMVGAGFSSVDKIMGFSEITFGNFDLFGWPYFVGGGQKLKLHGEAGSRRQEYSLSFVEPWFLDRKLALGVDLYRRESDYNDYEIKRTGAGISLSHALPGPNRIIGSYLIEDVEMNDLGDTNLYVYANDPTRTYMFPRGEEHLKSEFTLTVRHNATDSPFFPTRGNKAEVFGAMAGGPFGCDLDLYHVGGNSHHFVTPWLRHVLSLHTRYEVVEEYGDTERAPISELLFIGGGRTLRGFEFRDVGPKVVRTATDSRGETYQAHRPVGGHSLAMASVSYSIPLVAKLRTAVFYDIGNAWEDPYVLETKGLASSTGVGLRLDLPGFPIRIDRAWVIEKDDPLTDRDAWVFWIGYE